MKNPFHVENKGEKIFRQNLDRWKQMASITGAVDQALLRSQPPEALKLIGPEIEKRFCMQTKDCGQVFPVEEKDHGGRDITRYYGDIAKAYETCTLPPVKIKLAEVTHFDGHAYIKGQEPPAVQRAMLLRKNGFAE